MASSCWTQTTRPRIGSLLVDTSGEMRFERQTLALVTLTGLAVAVPLALVAASGREWDLAIATLFVAPLLSLVTWLSLRVRRRSSPEWSHVMIRS
jgi:hypothetical protein